MFVIQLPNGNLLVPESALAEGGQLMGDAYVEIGPGDADYARLAPRRHHRAATRGTAAQWQDGDAALQRQFASSWPARAGPGPGRGARRPVLTAGLTALWPPGHCTAG